MFVCFGHVANCIVNLLNRSLDFNAPKPYGLGTGVGRGLGVGADLGVGDGLAVGVGVGETVLVAVGVTVAVGVAVGVPDCAQYLPPVLVL